MTSLWILWCSLIALSLVAWHEGGRLPAIILAGVALVLGVTVL